MVFICGMSHYSLGIFHLANHAFFKALLFLTAGSIIHSMNDEQDIRRYGGLVKLLPFSYAMLFIGSLSLMGFPFLTGYYSKDIILEVAFSNYTLLGHFSYWLGSIAAFFTSFYSVRLIYLTFLTNTNSFKHIIRDVHDTPFLMAIPLFILALGSIFIGYFSKDMFIGLGSSFWGNSLFTLPNNYLFFDSEFLLFSIKLIPVIFSIFGAIIAFLLYLNFQKNLYNFKLSNLGYNLYTFLNKKWFFDKIYNSFIIKQFSLLGFGTAYSNIDKGIIEFLGPFGFVNLFYRISYFIFKGNTGYIYHYSYFLIFGYLFLIIYLNI